MTVGRIDFPRIVEAARAAAERLVPQWLPDGKQVGHEWKALNPMRADRKEGSFSINLNTGRWGDFATDDAGNDLISLYAYLNACENVEAAIELAQLLGIPDAAPVDPNREVQRPAKAKPAPVVKEAKPKREASWIPLRPVPDNAPPPPVAHEFRGRPERTWEYRDADGRLIGYVCRFVTSDGGKDIIPLSYCAHVENGKARWSWLSFTEPRPLYGLDRLAAKPDAVVLLVEGEKCADAGAAELSDLVVMSWPGGGKAAGKVDWSPLAGRRVMTWADCDAKRKKLTRAQAESGMDPMAQPLLPEKEQPGVKAMAQAREALLALGCDVWNIDIPAPGEVQDGWDIADAIAAGLTGEQLADHVRTHARRVVVPSAELQQAAQDLADGGGGELRPRAPVLQLIPGGAPTEAAQAGETKASKPPVDPWRYGLKWNKGELADCLANVFDILLNRAEWQGVLAYDEFSQRVVKLKAPPYAGGAVGEWCDSDDSYTAIWLTRKEGLTSSSARVAEAVEALARLNSVHPVRDWLASLPPHDGAGRLDMWLCDYLGAADTEYVHKVARYYLIGMVKRVMEPGCQFDYCLVLEGSQGKGKSSAFRVLGGGWFDDTDIDLNHKDGMASLQGVWLHEFSELGSLAKAEEKKQKSFLTRRIDKFRPTYARRDIKAPRQIVFGGTTNEWEWNKDPTGGRRFWPILCDDMLNLEGLAAMRDQLFAEALAAYRAGERCYPLTDEQQRLFDPEQLARQAPEALIDVLHDWVFDQIKPFSMATALIEGAKMDASKLTRDMTTRGGIALRALGCKRVEKRNGMTRYWYEPPERKGAMSKSGTSAQQQDDAEVPYAGF